MAVHGLIAGLEEGVAGAAAAGVEGDVGDAHFRVIVFWDGIAGGGGAAGCCVFFSLDGPVSLVFSEEARSLLDVFAKWCDCCDEPVGQRDLFCASLPSRMLPSSPE